MSPEYVYIDLNLEFWWRLTRGGCKNAPFGRIINRVNNVEKIGVH